MRHAPVRATRSALFAVPLIAIALAICSRGSPSALAAPAAAAYAPLDGVVEAPIADGSNVAQPCLHVVGHRKRREERLAASPISAAASTAPRLSDGWQVSPGAM
jgi:hypothetical protein